MLDLIVELFSKEEEGNRVGVSFLKEGETHSAIAAVPLPPLS